MQLKLYGDCCLPFLRERPRAAAHRSAVEFTLTEGLWTFNEHAWLEKRFPYLTVACRANTRSKLDTRGPRT